MIERMLTDYIAHFGLCEELACGVGGSDCSAWT